MKKVLLAALLSGAWISTAVAQPVPGPPPSSGGGTAANPTATASDTAVNGVASTYMRSDAAPAIQKGSSSLFGVVEVDNTSITAASGVVSATAPTYQQFTSGNWYWAQPYANMTAGSALTSGTIYFGTIYVPRAFTMANIGVRLTGTSASGLCQIGIYAASASTGFPTGAPLAVSATMSTTTAALISGAISGGLALSANTKYWAGLQCDNGASAVSGPGLTSDTYTPWQVGVTSQAALSNSSTNYSVLYSVAGAFSAGSMPTSPSVTGVQSNAVRTPAYNFSVQ